MAKVISWIVNDKYAYLGTAANDWTPTIRDTELPEEQVSDLSYYWLQNNNKQNYRDAYKKLYDAVNGIYTNLNPYGPDLSGADVYWDVLSQKGVMVISGKDGKNNDDPETPYYNLHNMNQNVAIGLGGDYVLDVDVTARTEFYIERNGIVRNNDVTNIRVIGADNYKSGLTENTITLDIKVPKNTSFAASPHNKQYTIIVECNGGSFTAQTYFTVTGVKDGAEGAYFNLIVFPKIVKKVETGGTVDYSDDYIDVSYTSNESSEGLSIKYKSAGGIGDFIDIPDVWKTGGIPASEVDAMEDSVMILGLFHGNQMIDTDTCTVTKDGRDADSHAVVELDNEMDGVSLGDDNVLNANISIGSGARLWGGRSEALVTTVILKDITHVDPAVVDCSVKSGNRWITDTFNPSTKEAIFDGIVATNKAEFRINFKDGYVFDNYRETITVELRGTINGDPVSAETNYIVVGVKGGKDGEVFRIMPSDDFISYDPNISQYSDDTLRFDAYIGLEQIVFGDVKYEQYEPYYSVNHTYSTYDELINAQGVVTGDTNEYDFDETQPGIKSVTLYLVYKDDNNERFIIDRETVPVVWNGLNGSDRIYLEIEDEIDPVSLGGDYTLDTETDFETSFVLYSGGTGISINKFDIDVSDNTFDGVEVSVYTNEYYSEAGSMTIVDKKATFVFEHENDGHVSISFTLGSGVTFDGDHKKRLTITAYRGIDGGFEQYAAIYTVLGIKEGEDGATYALLPSVNAISYDPNTDVFSPEIINCDAYCSGKKLTVKDPNNDSKFYIRYTVNSASTHEDSMEGTNELLPSGIDIRTEKARLTGDTKLERIFFYMFYEYEEEKFIMFDRESVPIVEDGLNASEKVFLELEDEIDPVSLGGDYVLDTSTEFATSFVLYSGKTEITFDRFELEVSDDTLNGVEVSAMVNGAAKTAQIGTDRKAIFNRLPENSKFASFEFVLSGVSFENNDHKKYITVSAYHDDVKYSADYIILGIKEGKDGVTYELMPSVNSIVYDPNTKEYLPETIDCKAYIDNELVTSSTFHIRYNINSAKTTTDGTRELTSPINIKNLESESSNDIKRIYFYLFYEYEHGGQIRYTMVDRESVPIVSDGTNAAERVFLEVEDEIDPVSLGGDYILNNETPFDTSFVLYSGTSAVSFDKIVIEVSDNTLDGKNCNLKAGVELNKSFSGNTVFFDGLNVSKGYLHLMLGGDYGTISFEENNHKKTLKITAFIGETGYSADYTLLGIRDGKDGETYSLRPSANSVVYDPNIGKYSPPSISCEAFIGSDKIELSDTNYSITYNKDTPASDDDYNATTALTSEGINILAYGGTDIKRIYFYLFYNYEYNGEILHILLDRESVPILTDGENGIDGKDADDRIYLELDEEMTGIAIGGGAGGDDTLDTDVTIEIPLSLYSGSTEIKFNKLEIEADTEPQANFIGYECVITNNDEEPFETVFDSNSTVVYEHPGLKIVNVKITLHQGLKFGEGNRRIITFKATFMDEVFVAKHTIIGLQSGKDGIVYKVLPQVNEVLYNPNVETDKYFPNPLKCEAYAGTELIAFPSDLFALGYKIWKKTDTNPTEPKHYNNNDAKPYPSTGITIDDTIERVFFCLFIAYDNDWLLLDRESVPIVKNGLNAQNRIYLELDEETTGIELGDDSKLDIYDRTLYPNGVPIEIDFHLFSGTTTLPINYIKVDADPAYKDFWCKVEYSTVAGGSQSTTAKTQFDSQGIATFNNVNPAAYDCTVTIYLEDGFNFGNENSKEVIFSVKEKGQTAIYTAYYTIIGVRGGTDGAIYRLIPDENTIVFDPNTNAYYPNEFGCEAYYGGEKITDKRSESFNGSETAPYVVAYTINTKYEGRNPIEGDPDPLGDLKILGKTTKLNIPQIQNLERLYFYLYLWSKSSNEYLKVDVESIPVTYDGVNAETVGYLELDNEMDGIGIGKKDGDVILDIETSVDVPFCIYSGLSKLTTTKLQIVTENLEISGCACVLKKENGETVGTQHFGELASLDDVVGVIFNNLTGIDKAVATITLYSGLTFETARTKKFMFSAFHNNEQYDAKYSIVGVPGGEDGEAFRLVASVNSVVFDQSKPAGQQYEPQRVHCSAFTGVEQITGCYADDNPQEFAITVNKGNSLTAYDRNKLLHEDNSENAGVEVTSKDRIYFQLWYHYDTTMQYPNGWMMIDSESIPVLTEGVKGEPGLRGAAMRGPYNWDDVIKSETPMWFCNGEENEYSGSSRFIDILLKGDIYYLCTTTYKHPAESGDNWNSVKGNWTSADTQYNFVAANVILGEKGNIKFMSNNEIYLMDQNNRITGGAKGGTGSDIIFWAGETNNGENLGSAPFKVYANGRLEATEAEISGNISADTGYFAGFIRIPYKHIHELGRVTSHCGTGFYAENSAYLLVYPADINYSSETSFTVCGYSGRSLAEATSIGPGVYLPKPSTSLNGFTYRIVCVQHGNINSAHGDGPIVMISVVSDSDRPSYFIVNYSSTGGIVGSASAIGFHGGYMEITCIGAAWVMTNCTGMIDGFGNVTDTYGVNYRNAYIGSGGPVNTYNWHYLDNLVTNILYDENEDSGLSPGQRMYIKKQ